MPISENGWDVIASKDDARLATVKINGRAGTISFRFHKDIAHLFKDLLDWFDKNIEPIQPSDSHSYSYRQIGGTSTWSNHASGTAVDLNALKHPLGAKNTFSAAQISAMRAKAASLGMRWGGDYRRPDEMHFEINFKPSQKSYASQGQTPALSPVPVTPYPKEPEPVWQPAPAVSLPRPAPPEPALPAPPILEEKKVVQKSALPSWALYAAAGALLTVTTVMLIYVRKRR